MQYDIFTVKYVTKGDHFSTHSFIEINSLKTKHEDDKILLEKSKKEKEE